MQSYKLLIDTGKGYKSKLSCGKIEYRHCDS